MTPYKIKQKATDQKLQTMNKLQMSSLCPLELRKKIDIAIYCCALCRNEYLIH